MRRIATVLAALALGACPLRYAAMGKGLFLGVAASASAVAAFAWAGDEPKPTGNEKYESLPLPPGALARCGRPCRGPAGEVLAVGFQESSGLIVAASADGTVHYFDRKGAHKSVICPDLTFVRACLSADAGRLVYSNNQHLRFVDIEPFRRPWTPKESVSTELSKPVDALAFGLEGDEVYWRNGTTLGCMFFPDPSKSRKGMVFAHVMTNVLADAMAGGNGLVALAEGARVRVLKPGDDPSVTFEHSFVAHPEGVSAVWLSKDAKTVVTGAADGTYAKWTVVDTTVKDQGAKLAWRLGEAGVAPVGAISVAKDGGAIAVCDAARVRVVDTRTGKEACSIAADDAVRCIALAPDHRAVVAGLRNGGIRLWALKSDLTQADEARNLGETPPWISRAWPVTFAGAAAVAALAGGEALRVWTLDGKEVASFAKADDGAAPVALSPDGATLLRATKDAVRLERTAGGDVVWTAPIPACYEARMSADGRHVAVYDQERVLHVLASDSGKEVAHATAGVTSWWGGGPPFGKERAGGGPVRFLAEDGKETTALAAYPDKGAAHVATDGTTALVRRAGEESVLVRGGADVGTLHVNDEKSDSHPPVYVGAFSDDGKLVAGGTLEGTIAVWDTATLARRALFAGHQGFVTAVAFLPDGKRLASAGADGTVIVWDLAKALTKK